MEFRFWGFWEALLWIGGSPKKRIPYYWLERILFDRKKTDYKITISKNASESVQWAAKELQEYLNKVSGAKFEIQDDSVPLSNKEIIIGFNKHSQKIFGNNFKEPDLTDESFIYKNFGSNIVILGGEQRGTMYGVFSFLENLFGVRWYTPEVTVLPQKDKFIF